MILDLTDILVRLAEPAIGLTTMKSLFLIVTIALFAVTSNAQKKLGRNDIAIQIRNAQILVDIYKNSNSAKLIYRLVDSIRQSSMEHDPKFKINMAKLEKSISSRSDTSKTLDEILSFIDSYTVYHCDSLVLNLKDNLNYKQLLVSVGQATKSELEPTIPRATIDGTSFTYKILTVTGEKRINAQSPTASSHPLLYNLLVRSLNIYRRLRPDGILKAKIRGVY